MTSKSSSTATDATQVANALGRGSHSEAETLSALMDGQGDELELRRLLKTLDSDPAAAEQLLTTWQRYHLVQDLIHDRGQPVGTDLAARIAAELENEPALAASAGTGWQKTVAKFAIAASVAAVFVVGMQASLQQSPASGPAPAIAVESAQPANETSPDFAPLAQPGSALLAEGGAVAVDPEAAARLRSYLEGIAIDVSEPVVTQHIQDSPLYRLVNQVQD